MTKTFDIAKLIDLVRGLLSEDDAKELRAQIARDVKATRTVELLSKVMGVGQSDIALHIPEGALRLVPNPARSGYLERRS